MEKNFQDLISRDSKRINNTRRDSVPAELNYVYAHLCDTAQQQLHTSHYYQNTRIRKTQYFNVSEKLKRGDCGVLSENQSEMILVETHIF